MATVQEHRRDEGVRRGEREERPADPRARQKEQPLGREGQVRDHVGPHRPPSYQNSPEIPRRTRVLRRSFENSVLRRPPTDAPAPPPALHSLEMPLSHRFLITSLLLGSPPFCSRSCDELVEDPFRSTTVCEPIRGSRKLLLN